MFWIHLDSTESEVLFVLCQSYAVIKRLFFIKIFNVFVTTPYNSKTTVKIWIWTALLNIRIEQQSWAD